jgi:hypothetical protein
MRDKKIHFKDSYGYIPCGVWSAAHLAKTSNVDEVTCKSCMGTSEYRNKRSKIDDQEKTMKYKLFYGDKVMKTGTIDEVKEWLNNDALHSADKYKLVKITNNTYTIDWELKLTKAE